MRKKATRDYRKFMYTSILLDISTGQAVNCLRIFLEPQGWCAIGGHHK